MSWIGQTAHPGFGSTPRDETVTLTTVVDIIDSTNLMSRIQGPCIAAALILIAGNAVAANAPKKEARVTQVIRDVKILPSESSARPAVVNEKVSEDTSVRTGDASRSELTFVDLTITRLGENTIFTFDHAGHNARLGSGTMLLRVPKNSGGGAIHTRAVTIGITGTTVTFEFTRAGRSKLIVLEGRARLSLVKYPKQSAFVRAGQMLDVPPGATRVPAPVNIDLDQVMKTSPLIRDFPPLPSQDLIIAAIQDQRSSGPGGPPVYQGGLVNQPSTGYPGVPPFYPGGPGGVRPPGHHPGRGTAPNNGDEPTGGQPSPSEPQGPGHHKPPVAGGGKVDGHPKGPSSTPPPVILRGQPTGSGTKGTTRGTAAHQKTPVRLPTPPPKKKSSKSHSSDPN